MKSGATESSYIGLARHIELPSDVFIHHSPVELANSSASIRILWSHHSYDQPCYLNFDHSICNVIVCPSQWLKDQFIKYHKIPEDKLVVIPNGVNEIFNYSEQKSKTLIHTSIPYKGLVLLPKIFPIVRAVHPDCELKVFSSMSLYSDLLEDPYVETYSDLIRMPGVQWSPAVDQEELVKHLQDSAIFVHPNIWEETSCVSLIEAQRCGCYPVISDIGALPETAGDLATLVPMQGKQTNTGWHVSDQFINTFAQSVIDALDHFDNNRSYYNEISRQCALQAARNHDWSVIAVKWRNLLRTLNEKVRS